ncbi:DUF350 domain-containing protein [Rhizobium sp. FKL33]|uniref:DUF350 domain-containing protein n=1 Tax=Rhizobium sp. FKL33 TaxID=2562307 RepID=UPI0010BFF0BE|nr:DUF350 domain-containing protein [Rhizobium sp. FKL33]
MDFKALGLYDAMKALAFVALYFALLLLAKWFKSLSISYHLSDQLVEHDNQAVGLAMAGYYLATAAIFVGALVGPSEGLPQDLLTVGGYSLLGLFFLNLARWFNDIAILRRFSDTEQLVKERNVGVGAVHFGVYLATGLVAAGAVSGQGGGVVSALVFFVLGQLSLLVFSLIYERFSSYDIHAELLNHNVAAGIAFGGNLVALAIVVMNASSGDFIDWKKDLAQFLTADLVAFVALPLIRLATDRLIIPGKSLGREIREDRNVGAGILEAALAIAFAVVLAFLI